jgi:hypothetical protein
MGQKQVRSHALKESKLSILVILGAIWLLILLAEPMVYLIAGLVMSTMWLCWFVLSLCFPRSIERPRLRDFLGIKSEPEKARRVPSRFIIV